MTCERTEVICERTEVIHVCHTVASCCFAQAAFHVSESDLLPKGVDSAVMWTSTVHKKMTANIEEKMSTS